MCEHGLEWILRDLGRERICCGKCAPRKGDVEDAMEIDDRPALVPATVKATSPPGTTATPRAGSGKMNVAMLCILNEVVKNRDEETGIIDTKALKIVYIAPMKALVLTFHPCPFKQEFIGVTEKR